MSIVGCFLLKQLNMNFGATFQESKTYIKLILLSFILSCLYTVTDLSLQIRFPDKQSKNWLILETLQFVLGEGLPLLIVLIIHHRLIEKDNFLESFHSSSQLKNSPDVADDSDSNYI
jgi:hypothetical protein